jgi:hypothetical protein
MTKHVTAIRTTTLRTTTMAGRLTRCAIVLPAVLAGMAMAADGEKPQADAAAAGRVTQQRARVMAQELVAGVLDVQIRQLEENGLASRPIHAEITAMRGNIDALVNREMREVVELLAKAETAAAGERAALVKDARALVRGIVARLSMERQQILRRLRVADIAAQVRRLIDRQQTVKTTTDALPRQVDGRREAVALAAIEDQRTVRTLYDTLTLALEDISGWGGSVGSGAVTGLRMLEESQVAAALAAAEGSLGTLDFAAASAAQNRVAESLQKLLATIETSRGAGGGNAAAALETLRSLTERGTQLRREMEKTPLTDAAVERILDSQAEFRQEMGRLAETLRGVPEVESLLEQADASAQEATSAVFEGDQQRAVAEEGKVIGALAAIAGRLQQDATMPPEARAAEQLARRLDDLRKAAAEMAAVGRRQAQATQAARANPPAAMAMEREVAAEVARIAAAGDLPPVVDARMEHAAEAAAVAARPPVPGMPQAAADAAALAAQRAIEAATAEIAAAIADTERARLAAKAGELSRAAEAVERAAAAERALARQARQVERSERGGPDEQGARPDPRGDLLDELTEAQQAVAEVAAKLTDAVRATAPQAAETLVNAQEPMQAARREFEMLAALDRRSDTQQPGEPAAREAVSGEQVPGEQQAGDRKPGDSQPADNQPGDNQPGEKQPGENQPGERQQSEQQPGAQKPGAQQPGQQQAGERQAGEEPAAGEASAEQPESQQPAAQQEAAAPGAAQQTPQQQADRQTPAPTDPAAQSADAAMPTERGSAEQARGEQQSGDQAAAAEAAKRAAAEAERAAEMLAQAAMEMRREAEEAAQELARSAEAQAEQVATARAAAEKAAAETAAAPQNQPGQPANPQQANPQPAGAPQQAAQRQQEQALANLAARETELVRDRVLAEEMLEAAREQSTAREMIAAQSAALERAESADTQANAAAGMPPDSAAAHEAAESLQRAEEQFADAQRTLGENAAAILEQSEIANQPLREALEQASQLDAEAEKSPANGQQESGMLGPREQQTHVGQGQPEGQPGEQGQSQQGQSQPGQQPQQAQTQESPSQQGQSQQGQSQAGQPQQGQAQQGQAQQGQAQQGQAQQGEMGSEAENSLGTGFVPNAPERTAEMIAGRQAQEAAESLLGGDASAPQPGALATDDGGSESPSSEGGPESSGSPDSAGTSSSETPESDPSQSASASDGQAPNESQGQSQDQSQSAGSQSGQSQAGQSQPGQQASGEKGSSQQASSRSEASGRQESSADGKEGSQRGEGGTRGGRRTEATADGPLRQIEGVGKGKDSRAGERSGDAEAAEKSFEREPWFAKLPPEMRKAIRAKSQRRAPRGYEEKLDRYFQNIDE